MNAGNSFTRGPPRMERGRGGVGAGYRGNRGGSFNPINPAQPMGFAGYEAKGWFRFSLSTYFCASENGNTFIT